MTESYNDEADPNRQGQRWVTVPGDGGFIVGAGVGDAELPHGSCLTTDDVDRIQAMINEFCLKSLLPNIERQMKLLSEAVNIKYECLNWLEMDHLFMSVFQLNLILLTAH